MKVNKGTLFHKALATLAKATYFLNKMQNEVEEFNYFIVNQHNKYRLCRFHNVHDFIRVVVFVFSYKTYDLRKGLFLIMLDGVFYMCYGHTISLRHKKRYAPPLILM